MEQLLPRAMRSLPLRRTTAITIKPGKLFGASLRNDAFICFQCQSRALSMQQARPLRRQAQGQKSSLGNEQRRGFSSNVALKDTIAGAHRPRTPLNQTAAPPSAASVRVAPDEDLPSHKEGQKWTLTKRVNQVMDRLLARLSIAGHEINKYTGTDYSGIEALRREIKEQEELVKTHHAAVRAAKARFDEAQTLQMASNKEVVALLERKNSWASTDLERYMSLIRSEHVNEQSVTAAREGLLAAERTLEEARSRLERRERAQYHEEQIWSDTIRRNSTWVTFGLMGFNVVLLLANIGVVEPWRRNRMVREIQASMGEKAQPTQVSPLVPSAAAIEFEVDEVVVPQGSVDKLESAQMEEVLAVAATADDFVGGSVTAAPLQKQADEDLSAANLDMTAQHLGESAGGASALNAALSNTRGMYSRLHGAIADLFSSRTIAVKKFDLTAIALEGTAVGAALTAGLLVLFLRTR